MTDKPLISVAQAADLWGRSKTATYQSARRRELPGLCVLNGRFYVKRTVLLAWPAGQDGNPNGHEAERAD